MSLVIDELSVNVQGAGAAPDGRTDGAPPSGAAERDPDPHVQIARLSFEIGRRDRRRDRLVAD